MGHQGSSVGTATGYGVADQLRLTDCKGAKPRDTWKLASYVRGNEGFGNRNSNLLILSNNMNIKK
jgi:hypothetical protein